MESVLLYLLKSAGILSLFYVFYVLLLKNDTSFTANRKFLLSGILASLVLPAIYFTKKVFITAPEIVFSESTANFSSLPANISQEPDWWFLAGSCYLLISAFFMLRFFFRIFQILKIIQLSKSRKVANFNVVETNDLTGPFSFFHYIFMINGISNEEYQIMLRHEKVHATQHHSVDMLLSNFIAAVLWFNPISWRYKRIVEQNLEFIADQETAKASCIQNYQHLLVKVSTKSNPPVLVNHFYQSFIKKRIVMLNKKNTSAHNAWKYQLILPVLAVFMMSFNVKTKTEFITGTSSENSTASTQEESLSVTIANTTETESLEHFKKIFLKWDVELSFKNIEYSKNGEIITGIKVEFKNLKSGEVGVLVKNDSKGIAPFEIYSNKNGKTGFRDVSPEEFAHKNAGLQLKEIGKNPLYLIDNREYSSAALNGKTIATQNTIDVLKPKDALKRFGTKAGDGAIIVNDGKIIEDFEQELKRIDAAGNLESRYFIEIHKDKLPVFISLSNKGKSKKNDRAIKTNGDSTAFITARRKNKLYNLSDSDSLTGKDSIRNVSTKNGNRITWVEKDSTFSNKGWKIKDSVHVKKMKSLKDEAESFLLDKNKKLLIILDGEQMPKSFNIDEISPEDIKQLNVIKGKAAAMTYGERAKDGVIEIITKENPNNNAQAKFIIIDNASKGSNKMNISTNTDGALVIVNGKIKKKDFNIDTINIAEIESVNIIKGDNAVKKYGEKAARGAIEISLKEEK